MKKHLASLSLLLLLSVIVLQVSCKKDDVNNTTPPCPAATYQMPGLWVGKYTVTGSSQTPLSYSMSVFSDGTISVRGEATPGVYLYSNGTWALSNNVFTASVTSSNAITQSITGTFSNNGTLSNATWMVTSSPFAFNAGTFVNMARIN